MHTNFVYLKICTAVVIPFYIWYGIRIPKIDCNLSHTFSNNFWVCVHLLVLVGFVYSCAKLLILIRLVWAYFCSQLIFSIFFRTLYDLFDCSVIIRSVVLYFYDLMVTAAWSYYLASFVNFIDISEFP